MRTEAQKLAEKRYREKHRAALNARNAEWRKNNPDKVAASKEAYRSNPENRKKESAYTKKWQQENPEKHREHAKTDYYRHYEKRREYRKENAESRSLKSQAWNAAHKEHRKAYMAAYQKANPEKFYEACMMRRAKMYGTSTIGDRKAIVEWMKSWRILEKVTCRWCKKTFRGNECHADHIIPLGLDGPHTLENLAIACASCNRRKNKQHPDKFSQSTE